MSWIKTPYHHHGRIKGVGVDCAQLLCLVYEAAGVIQPLDPGYYPVDWHLHRSEEMYAHWMFKYAHVYDAQVKQPQPGDVALFKFGRCFSHGAIVVENGLLVHAYLNRGVILSRADEEPLAGRKVTYWTLK
jgi:cell wall-associated NlpC family hydrolase